MNSFIEKEFELREKLSFIKVFKHKHFNIVAVVYDDEANIDLTKARLVSKHCQKVVDCSQPAFALTIAGRSTNIDENARAFFANDSFNQKTIKATSVVLRSLHHRLIYRVYLKFNKPKSPIKAFRNEKRAFDWLIKQVAKHNQTIQKKEKVFS